MAIKADTQVTFDVIRDDNYGHTKDRVIIPKHDFVLLAEDEDYYYLAEHIHLDVPTPPQEGGTDD